MRTRGSGSPAMLLTGYLQIAVICMATSLADGRRCGSRRGEPRDVPHETSVLTTPLEALVLRMSTGDQGISPLGVTTTARGSASTAVGVLDPEATRLGVPRPMAHGAVLAMAADVGDPERLAIQRLQAAGGDRPGPGWRVAPRRSPCRGRTDPARPHTRRALASRGFPTPGPPPCGHRWPVTPSPSGSVSPPG